MHICEPRQFLRPCLLLLLKERPGHGYELADRLKPFGVGDGDSGTVYRTLRALERLGLARSVWRPSDAGPARRTYHLTDAGHRALADMVREVHDTRRTLDDYLDRYQRSQNSASGPAPRRPAPSDVDVQVRWATPAGQSSAADQSIVDSNAG
jgi:poly-beta-hydroxybutyrate-responsive repressor